MDDGDAAGVTDPERWGIDPVYYPEGPDAGREVEYQVRDVARMSWALNNSEFARRQLGRAIVVVTVAVVAVLGAAVVFGVLFR